MPTLLTRFLLAALTLFTTVISWRILSVRNTNQASESSRSVSTTAFTQTLDAGKGQKVFIAIGSDPADRDDAQKGRADVETATIATQDLPDLIKKMIDDGASVEFAQARKSEPGPLIPDFMPLMIMFGLVGYSYYPDRKRTA